MSDINQKICPYCGKEIAENDDYVVCSICRTVHHTECWLKNKHCAREGCTGASTSSGYGKTDSPFYIKPSADVQKSETLSDRLTEDNTVAGEFVTTALVGKKAEYYIPKFREMDKKKLPISFNPAAFLLGWYWCFYRKLYVPAFVIMAAQLCVFGLPIKGYFKYLTVGVLFLVNGLSGNYLYKKRIEKCCKNALNLKGVQRTDYISKKQGVNFILPIVLFVIISIISLIQQYLPYAQMMYKFFTA